MGRTRLRGVEVAGIRFGVEAPSCFPWDWPAGALASLACSAVSPDVYVGVRVEAIQVPDFEPITYAWEGGTFDIGRHEDDWIVLVHGRRRCERMARFNHSFSEGEVILSPEAAARCSHPLEQPLLDVALVHRTIRNGGLMVAGTAVLREGRALAFLGHEEAGTGALSPVGERAAGGRGTMGGDRFVLRAQDGVVRLYGVPDGSGPLPNGGSARVDALHVMTRSNAVFAERLGCDAGSAALLEHVYAPVHDPESTLDMMEAADRVISLIPVMKFGMPEEARVVPFTWGHRRAALAFAPPAAS